MLKVLIRLQFFTNMNVNNLKQTATYLLLLTSTVACSWDMSDPASAWYYPRAGSTLILHERLVINPNTAALYIQHGKVTGGKHSRFDPYCKIRVRNVRSTQQFINPGRFTITHSGRHTELVAGLSGLYIPLGKGSKPQLRFNISSSDAPSDITETIQMGLSSTTQPNVMSLVCGGVEDHPANAEAPTYTEMKEALGGIMSLRIKP